MRNQETLTYVNEVGESITFSASSIYHVDIDDVLGLSDMHNEINSISSMGQHGDSYIGSRIKSRDIEIPGYIKERDKERRLRLRRELNHVLNPEYNATLIYQFGSFKRVIKCRVSGTSPHIKNPVYRNFVIQLIALNPFWRDEKETRVDIATWIGGFEFPIRDITDKPDGLEIPDDGTWEIGYREPTLIVNVPNSGDVKSGIRIEFRALGVLTNPELLNINTGEFIKFNMSMAAGDRLTVTTSFAEKTVTLKHNGIESDAFRYIDPDSTYLQVTVGDNLFRYDAEIAPENLEATIYFYNQYSGV